MIRFTRKNKHILSVVSLIFCYASISAQVAGKIRQFSLKTGVNTSYQKYDNIPTFEPAIIPPDTLWRSGFGWYNRTGLNLTVCYETMLSSKLFLTSGLGYRQRGFDAESVYDPTTGIIGPGTAGVYSSNRVDYLTLDLGIKLLPFPTLKWKPYFSLANRLGFLVSMNTPFWKTRSGRYGGYRQSEYSPVVCTGIEIPLKGLTLFKAKETGTVGNPYAKLLIEIEYNPGIMNIHKSSERYQTQSPLQVSSPAYPKPLPIELNRAVYNQSLGLNIGLIF
jgi:hypothetical protein